MLECWLDRCDVGLHTVSVGNPRRSLVIGAASWLYRSQFVDNALSCSSGISLEPKKGKTSGILKDSRPKGQEPLGKTTPPSGEYEPAEINDRKMINLFVPSHT